MRARTILRSRPKTLTRATPARPLRGAVSPDPPRDLRRLKRSYGKNMANVFHFTVTHGRPDKGMPDWTGRLDDETLWIIFAFLQTVQAEP